MRVEAASVTSQPSKTPQPERMTATLGDATTARCLAAVMRELALSESLDTARTGWSMAKFEMHDGKAR